MPSVIVAEGCPSRPAHLLDGRDRHRCRGLAPPMERDAGRRVRLDDPVDDGGP
jgi:hypothetical protein